MSLLYTADKTSQSEEFSLLVILHVQVCRHGSRGCVDSPDRPLSKSQTLILHPPPLQILGWLLDNLWRWELPEREWDVELIISWVLSPASCHID